MHRPNTAREEASAGPRRPPQRLGGAHRHPSTSGVLTSRRRGGGSRGRTRAPPSLTGSLTGAEESPDQGGHPGPQTVGAPGGPAGDGAKESGSAEEVKVLLPFAVRNHVHRAARLPAKHALGPPAAREGRRPCVRVECASTQHASSTVKLKCARVRIDTRAGIEDPNIGLFRKTRFSPLVSCPELPPHHGCCACVARA